MFVNCQYFCIMLIALSFLSTVPHTVQALFLVLMITEEKPVSLFLWLAVFPALKGR